MTCIAALPRKAEFANNSHFGGTMKFLIYAMPYFNFSKLCVNKRSQAGISSLCTFQGDIVPKRKAYLKGQNTKSIFPGNKILNVSLNS